MTEKIIAKTSKLVEGLQRAAQSVGVKIQTPQAGSMFGIFFSTQPVTNYDEAAAANQDRFKKFFAAMLEQRIYLAPSQFETLFMSAAHTDEDLEKTLTAAEKAFSC